MFPKLPGRKHQGRKWNSYSPNAENSLEKKERNKILIEIRDLLNDHDPELIDRNVMDFPLSSKRRWYDKDPIAWMTINGLMFAEDKILEKAVAILASRVPN